MSVDTTVVIAAYRFPGDSELVYTAAVVQAANNLNDDLTNEFVMKWAHANFINHTRPWFGGKGGLSRAKQFANLLAEDLRENGKLTYEERPMIEIGPDRLYRLARKGTRISDSQFVANVAICEDRWYGRDEDFDRAQHAYIHGIRRPQEPFGPFQD